MESKLLLYWVVLVAFLLGGWWCGCCDGCWDQEKTALLQLKPFFNNYNIDDGVESLYNWVEAGEESTSDCCEWERVECNSSTGRVIRLFLNLTTTVPLIDVYGEDIRVGFPITYAYHSGTTKRGYWYLNASLFLPFEELKSLYLGGNYIAGCVDNQGFEKLSAKLDKLEILDLSDNHFNDSILASLSELSSLKSLNLGSNQFTGSNPSDGIKRLSKLKNLENLDLHANIFGNNIVSNLGAFTSLRSLRLQNCGLKGTVQMLEFNNLMNLKELYLGENEIESLGSLFQEKEELRLVKLEVLGLSSNLFNNSIFSSLNSFSDLKSLYLENNRLEGAIHIKEFNNLMNLKELYLGGNKIKSLGSLFQEKEELRLVKLEVLDLSNNLFNNSIFSSLNSFSNLKFLSLESNRLEGAIHIKELNALSNLEKLYMGYNGVNDFVPSQDNETELKLMNLKVLHLSENLFNNSILSSLGRLSNLKSLFFGGTKLEGSIDLTELNSLTYLEELVLHCGTYDFYTLTMTDNNCSLSLQSLGLFPSLKTLYLEGFSFQGTKMTSQNQSHNFTNLEELSLESSFLQTNFLGSIGQFTSLKRLSLYYCEINGSLILQDQRHNFTSLEELILRRSFLRTNFFGSIGEFTSLKRLVLNDCEMNGSLTLQGICELTNLQQLDIQYNNNLKGNLPDCFSNLSSLQTLDLSSNQLSGNIFALENLTSLEILDLSFNQFSENISALETLTSLKRLDLSSNQFSGNISALETLTSLQVLGLSNNYFQIPISLGPLLNLSKLKSIFADNNTIYAETQMHSLAPTFQLKKISLSCCEDVGSFPEFLYHQHDLQYLDLSNIYFKGNQFPNWLLENNTKLVSLFLTNSSLSGPLQLPLAPHKRLSYLEISNNFFNGSIPVEIGAQLPSLGFLNMSKNYFSGSIPSSFGDMSSLEILDLSNNKLSGGIPEHLAMSCPSLRVLALSNNTLQGKIFSENFNLTNLSELQLDGNNFSGSIPDFLSKSYFLSTLDVSNNRLSGRIPDFLSKSSFLLTLDVSNNRLSGRIPDLSKSSFLSTLDVSNNRLSGRIPRWMGNMSFMEKIIMSNNHLEGKIPVEFCQLDLILLDLSVNNISGSLPSCFGPLQIRQVHLSKNRLRGTLPNALRNSSTLVTLDISDNFLTGSIPSWIGGLSNLSYLLLSKNNFEGGIPIELCKLNHLSLINLSHNNLSGCIPSCLKITTLEDVSEDYVHDLIAAGPNSFSFNEPIEFPTKNMSYSYKGRILPYMSGIDLSCNKLVGEIPYEIGNFYKILVLNLSHNSLTGPIPPTFANLRGIESLDLSYNNLSGNIPPQLVGLTFLSCFIVSFNNLSGKTPARIAEFGTFDESSYRGNPFLCGEPLPKCANTGPSAPMPNGLTDSEEDDGSIDMEVFYVTLIVTYIVVLLSIAFVLYINPYWRRAWFYHVEIITTSSYYFVLDNILPRRFHCGNM